MSWSGKGGAADRAKLHKRGSFFLVFVFTIINAYLLAKEAQDLSPAYDEGGHFLSGAFLAEDKQSLFYYSNPPLIKLLSYWSAKAAGFRYSLPPYHVSYASNWFPAFIEFVHINRRNFIQGLVYSRVVLVTFYVLGAFIIWLWAYEIFSAAGAYVAPMLWIFNPIVLGYSNLLASDVPCAALALLSAYLLYRYSQAPSARRILIFGIIFALTVLTKFSALIFLPLFLLYAAIETWRKISLGRQIGHILISLSGALLVINAAYLFQKTPIRLSDFKFYSSLFSGQETQLDIVKWQFKSWGNRFADSIVGNLRIPLPEAMIRGIDEQLAHESAGLPSYMNGIWQDRGGWYSYYLFGFLVRMPIYLLLILLIFLLYVIANITRVKEVRAVIWYIWGCSIFFFVFISLNKGLNSHFRYIIPSLPFLFLGLACLVEPSLHILQRYKAYRFSALIYMVFLVLIATPAVAVYPNYMSYFNSAVGSWKEGWRYLADSNIDWGQDLGKLEKWLQENLPNEQIGLAYFGSVPPQIYNINFKIAPPLITEKYRDIRFMFDTYGPKPGWYAVSTSFLAGTSFGLFNEKKTLVFAPRGGYSYFTYVSPKAYVGSSIFIYHLTDDDVRAIIDRLSAAGVKFLTN